jgi:ABC-type transporter Mla subunit MlaD
MNPFKAVENLILGPPRLFVRTLDDFHTLVEIAGDANRRLDRIEDLVTEMTQQLAILVKMVGLLQQGGETMIAAAKRVDTMARDVISIGDRVDASPDALKDVSVRVEEAAGQLQQRAKELAEQGAEVAAAVPILQRAMEVAGPSIEGALSRLGQLMAPPQASRAPDEAPAQPRAAPAQADAEPSPPPAAKPKPKPKPAAGEA